MKTYEITDPKTESICLIRKELLKYWDIWSYIYITLTNGSTHGPFQNLIIIGDLNEEEQNNCLDFHNEITTIGFKESHPKNPAKSGTFWFPLTQIETITLNSELG